MPALQLRPNARDNDSRFHVRDLFTSDTNRKSTPPSVSNDTRYFSLRKLAWSQLDPYAAYKLDRGAKPRRRVTRESPLKDRREQLTQHPATVQPFSKPQEGSITNSEAQTSEAHTLVAFEDHLENFKDRHCLQRFTPVSSAVSDLGCTPFSPTTQPDISAILNATPQPRCAAFPHPQSTAGEEQLHFDHDLIPHLHPLERLRTRHQQTQSIIIDNPASDQMATEQAPPPVSYDRLRQLTTEACDATLSSIKSYSHSETEGWNTQIINTILTALVQESTPSPTETQPSFKFIVNSTIIQHAPVASGAGDDAVKSAGRRGMHSASGAFWNNERDGMWSFKYEAAEGKGLDVVVGIIWIWVG